MDNTSGKFGPFLVAMALLVSSIFISPVTAVTGPPLQSAIFFGGAGDQRGSAVAIDGADLYVAGYTQTPTVDGLLVRYGLPPGAPVWSNIHSGTNYNSIALNASTVYGVGQAQPPVCGASDGAGDTERKVLLDRYTRSNSFIGCGSLNFFPYRGIEYYLTAKAVNESGTDFVYAAGQAEQTGFSSSFPFVVVKYDSAGSVVLQATEPGITLGSSSGCCPGDSNAYGIAELNGFIYIAGNSRLPGQGEDNVERPVLMKYDAGLNRLWKARPADRSGFFRAVTAFGGNVYAVGHEGFGSGADYLIEKYDETGARLWTTTAGAPDEDVLTGVIGAGGRLFAVGYTRSSGAGGADAVLLEIDPSTGATSTPILYGGAQDDFANGVSSNGSDLYVVGESRSFASVEGNAVGQNDVMLLRYSVNQSPVAKCKNVTVSAGANCTANASIDDGSFDPDAGDTITLAQSPPGPYSLGTTSVTLTLTDNHGASSQCVADVTVIDTMAPVLTCPGNVFATLPLNSPATSMPVSFAAPAASDNCSTPMLTVLPASGSVFSVGPTTVNVTATDGAGNQSTCAFIVTVLHNFSGFFQPVDNAPIINVANAGSSIPVKFSLSGNKGLNILAAGYPVSQPVACSSGAPLDSIEETATAGNSSLSYDPATDRYIYVWKTEKTWKGTCRQLIVKLNDGSTHVCNFQFK